MIVLPDERTAVMGVVNILKTLAQSSGPAVTGILAGHGHFWVAFIVAGSLKAAYDLMLLAFFGGRLHPRKDNSDEVDGHSEDSGVSHDHQDIAGLTQGPPATEQDVSANVERIDSTSTS